MIPLGNVGAPEPLLSVILPALILPPLPDNGPGCCTSVPIPRISGMKSSPSEMIRSTPSSRTIS